MPIRNRFWFLLGRFTEISAAEIAAFLNFSEKDFEIYRTFLVTDKVSQPAHELINILGGTIKITEELFSVGSADEIIERCVEKLSSGDGKIIFGISAYLNSTPHDTLRFVKTTGMTIKKTLQASGCSARFVFNSESTLSSVTVEKNSLVSKGCEFNIIQKGSEYFVTKTVAVQPFEEWGRRDYGRPERDDLSGMLPPKLARIMINLAHQPLTASVYDPFCGSGTIINEAVDLGYTSIIGSDISEKAVMDAKTNLAWLSPEKMSRVRIFQSDIGDVAKQVPKNSIDAVIAEPYLGKPLRGRETRAELEKQADEITNLYITAFDNLAQILRVNGVAVLIVPRFKQGQDWITLDIKQVALRAGFSVKGYIKTGNQNNDFLLYARPEQRVGREIWRFIKTK